MDYIIINGIDSREINGLIIQSLPPIIKPKKRVKIEEIDGVDGDLITDNGYMAYDKEFEIGLSYNYDIDEIVSFFDNSGTIIFSNEEDKYYNFKIYEQINFEKLLRFKIAKVKVHVQPFKFLLDEQKYQTENVFENKDQKSFIINDANGTIDEITLDLTDFGYQDQYSPIVKSIEERKIVIHNKNLFDTTDLQYQSGLSSKNGLTVSVSNDEITITGTATADTELYIGYETLTGSQMDFLTASDYTLSYDGRINGIEKMGYKQVLDIDDVSEIKSEILVMTKNQEYTTKSLKQIDINKINIFGITILNGSTVDAKFKVQLELGNKKTFYLKGDTKSHNISYSASANKIYKLTDVQVFNGANYITSEILVSDPSSMLSSEKTLYNQADMKIKYIKDNIFEVYNCGNINSKPTFTIYGNGNINVYLNNEKIMNINLGNEKNITIDISKMEAYKDNISNLKNRLVTCDYEKINFKKGKNELKINGTVEAFMIYNQSRFI